MARALALLPLLAGLAAGSVAEASIWPTAEVRVERALTDGDVVARREAVLALQSLPRRAAASLALRALGDADVDVRIAALRVATERVSDDLGPKLASWLSEPDARVRLAAAEALSRRPSPAAIAALGRASSDADGRVRGAVARALGASFSAEAVVPLLGRLDDPLPEVRRDVVNALGRLADRRAVVPLLARVQDTSALVRKAAARSLGLLGDARAGSALVLVLRDSDPEVRIAALDAVGRLREATAVPSIVAELSDGESNVRAAAANALARLGTPAALAALVAELARDDEGADPIVQALVLAGDKALPVVRACVETRGVASVTEGCARALGELGDASDVPRLRALLDRRALSPLVALPALAHLGAADAVPVALEALSSPDMAVRRSGTLALAELLDPKHPDGRAVEPLLQALRARSVTLVERALLVRLLGRTGELRVGADLARIARESTPKGLVAAALLALGELGTGPWEPLLFDELDAEDGSVRTAAALALRRTASAAAFVKLLERLDAGAEQDRLALGLALPGAAAAARDPALTSRLSALLAKSRGAEREPLLESWVELARPAEIIPPDADVQDRRKLAEALSGKPSAVSALWSLAEDRDSAVRANAAWSLGQLGGVVDVERLARLVGDREASVAANALTSLGRVAATAKRDLSAFICPHLADPRAIVRESAALALRALPKPCAPGTLERLLASDPASRVRRASARTLASLPRTAELENALERCAIDDASSEVAAECSERGRPRAAGIEPVVVFVVPTGAGEPRAGAPFALRFADGTVRFGLADRRGAVVERFAPGGALELGVLPPPGE